MAISAGCDQAGPLDPLPSAYTEDFDAAWTFIRDTCGALSEDLERTEQQPTKPPQSNPA